MDTVKIAAAFRALADAFEAKDPGAIPQPSPLPPTEAPAPRGRGRPPKAATEPAAAPAPAAAEPDPFAPPAVQELPPKTIEEVRAALKALQAATNQAKAVAVLKAAGGADNLAALQKDKYAAVVEAATAALPKAAAPEADPFDAPPAAPPTKPVTIEDVKAAVVAAQKRTSTDTVQKVVMEHGGKAAKDGGGYGPSLKALPPESYADVIVAIENLPTTK